MNGGMVSIIFPSIPRPGAMSWNVETLRVFQGRLNDFNDVGGWPSHAING